MFCMSCGAELPDGAAFCSSCGAKMGEAPVVTQPEVKSERVPSELVCPNCFGHNTVVQVVEEGQTTTKKGIGLGGHANNMARGMTAVATLGMSNLVWKKSKGTNKTKTVNKTVRVCQDCGHMWEVGKSGGLGSSPISIFK